MKNAGKLLMLLAGIFTVGFLYETASVLINGTQSSDPVFMYIISYGIGFLLPALISFLVGRKLYTTEDRKTLK